MRAPFFKRLLSASETEVDDFAKQIAYHIRGQDIFKVAVDLVKDPVHADVSTLDQRYRDFLSKVVPSSGLQ
jgi:hypothetical protein